MLSLILMLKTFVFSGKTNPTLPVAIAVYLLDCILLILFILMLRFDIIRPILN